MKYGFFVIIISVLLISGCGLFRTAEIPQINDAIGPIVVTPDHTPDDRRETFKRYDRVITRDAVSDTGLFIVHRIKEKLFYEIPEKELGKEFLLITRLAKAQAGTGWGGQRINNQVLRWERVGDNILLRRVSHGVTADSARAIFRAVRNANFEPIIVSFPIEAVSKNKDHLVIDVTRLFTTDVQEISVRQHFRGRRVDPDRSYIDRVNSFPDNIEVRNILTMDVDSAPGQDATLRTISVMYHHSMFRLPEDPMMPRLYDERVGFFSVRRIDYGLDAHRAQERRFITRWRLEKKDPGAEISEPVKPVAFYVDPATPEQWVPWVKRGIEEWQGAFEKAGFRNAIIAKIPPTSDEDPDWSPEDARYPTVRWFPSTVANAMGPHVHDPRTGEILTSSIQMHHNVMNLLRNWYFVQGSAADLRARTHSFPDSLMGRLIQYVVAHEVGHALGFPHNMKASGMVPTDSLRSTEWTHRYGTTPSIMDYARMNYIAQPGDSVYMFPRVSVYDEFAVEWGYTPFPGADSPDAERPYLEEIVSRQEQNPLLLFGHLSTVDPTQQREALSDNHVLATRYGIENIKRIMGYIVDAAGAPGDDYSVLRDMYLAVIQQRERMLEHVVNWIGGVYGERKVYGQEGVVHTPISYERQKEAMEYLIEEGFHAPEYLIDSDVLRRIEPAGTVDRIARLQRRLLTIILDDARLNRMSENETIDSNSGDVYSLGEMLDDIRHGIWSELENSEVDINIYRRNIQRAYVEILNTKLTDEVFRADGEIRAFLRGNLREVRLSVENARPRAANRATLYHIEDISVDIEKILENN